MSESQSDHEQKLEGGLAIFLRRPIGVMMSLALVCLLGSIAYFRIPLQLLPDGLSPPFMWVAIPTLAASPEENELLIAKPIEDALSTLAEIDEIKTYIRTNNVGFAVDLHAYSDPDLSYLRVRSRLRRQLPQLPEGAQFAFIWRHDPNDDPLYVFSVTYPPHTHNPAQVIKDRVIKTLERIPGVSRVELRGIEEKAIRIKIKADRLKEARMTATELLRILRADHFTLTVGQIIEGERALWLNASSRFKSLEDLKARPITANLSLGELAEVSFSAGDNRDIHRVNGKEAASITVYKVASENTIDVSESIQAELDQVFTFDSQLHDYERIEFFSQGEFIKSSLQQIQTSAVYGGLIALISLWFFLRSFGLTLMITTSIPLCLMATIALLYMNEQSLNVLSMMGIILSVGMVIDNAIVVLEQVMRLRRQGYSPYQAAWKGTGSVGLAIALATATTVVVFLPIMMLSDQPMVGFFITRIGEPVCYGLGASLLVALIHLPTASQYLTLNTDLSSKELKQEYNQQEEAHEGYKKTLNELRSTQVYYQVLNWVLNHRLVVSFFTLLCFASVGFPASELDRVDKGGGAFKTLTVHIRGPLNGPQKQLERLAQSVEEQVLKNSDSLDIKTVVINRGWSPEHLKVDLYLKAPSERVLNKLERETQLKPLLPTRPGYKIFTRRGMGQQSDGVNISVFGPYLHSTQEQAESLLKYIKSLPGIDNAELDLPEGGLELQLGVNQSYAAIQTLSPLGIAAALSAEMQERSIGELVTSYGESKIYVSPDSAHMSLDNIAKTINKPTSDAQLKSFDQPLDGVVDRDLQFGSGKIRRRKRRVQVNILVRGQNDGAVMSVLEQKLPGYDLPIGFGIDYGERFKERASNEEGGLIAVSAGMLLVFCLMGVLFESILTPLAILGTIPLAFVGAIWMLWFCGTAFEVMAMIGGVILVGVVVNNGIVLIDRVQVLRREGLDRNQAVLEAASTRLRPILMTAITTIGGLIPMAFGGGESIGIDYQPLGQVVVGGLMTSTLLTLVVIPLLYTLVDDLRLAGDEGMRWLHYFSKQFKQKT